MPRLDPRNLLRPSFFPYSCAVSWICFGSYCCLYPMMIVMNGALSRIPWRVRYLACGTIDRLKTRGVSPELVKRLCVPVFKQRLYSKENVLIRLLRCCSHLQEPRDICGLFYVHLDPDFTLLNTLCLHYYHTYYLCS